MAEMFNSPEGYENLVGRFSKLLAPLFLDFAQVKDVGKILDAGCGTGSLTQALVERTHEANIVGIDLSKSFIEYSRSHFAHNRRISLGVGSALELPYPDSSFTQCLSCLVIQFIPNATKAVAEMVRVTQTDGTVAACTWHSDEVKMASIFWEEALKLDSLAESHGGKPNYLNAPGQLSALWKAIGMKKVTEISIEVQMQYESFDDYWVGISRAGPSKVCLDALTQEQGKHLRTALRKRLLDDGADRPFSLPAKALAVRGVVA